MFLPPEIQDKRHSESERWVRAQCQRRLDTGSLITQPEAGRCLESNGRSAARRRWLRPGAGGCGPGAASTMGPSAGPSAAGPGHADGIHGSLASALQAGSEA